MASIKQIKQDIQDWYDLEDEPFIAAFTSFVDMLSWRRSEVTLPSGIAKLVAAKDTYVVFSVGGQLLRADREASEIKEDYTLVRDWQVKDLREIETVLDLP